MIQIYGNDIKRGETKLGWVSGNDIINSAGKKLGYVEGGAVCDMNGRRVAHIEGDFVFFGGGKKRVDAVIANIRGGFLTTPMRVAIEYFFGD